MTGAQLGFDLAAGAAARDRGIALTTLANLEFVLRMRPEAHAIAAAKGEVFIDDVRARALELGIAPTSSAAWGPIFGERGVWQIVDYRPSEWPGNHGHRSPVRVLARES